MPKADAADLAAYQPLLWRLCYRMTGSAADAEDLVQDTFARAIERPPPDQQRELRPWLVQIALNLSRDHLRRRKRRGYQGPWLPAPIETEGLVFDAHPEARYDQLESVSSAFLLALEALTPAQRAVVLLCDVLGYSVREAAQALAMREGNVKTTHHRARAALADYDRTRLPPTRALQEQTRSALMQLMTSLLIGDVAALEALVSDDVRALHDSAGEYLAARVPVLGRERVLKLYLALRRSETPRLQLKELNGLPGILCEYLEAPPRAARRFVFSIALDAHGRIREMNAILATPKLSRLPFGSGDAAPFPD
jgi:RNA polymerase sigma-70 factor (ECF subfamily)